MKFLPHEFIVEEIDKQGNRLKINTTFEPKNFEEMENDEEYSKFKFVHFVLQKTNWNTTDALIAIGRKMYCTYKRFDFAGTKDRSSISTQMASGFMIDEQKLMGLTIKDIKILGAWKSESKIRLGQLLGNGFNITLNKNNCGFDGNSTKITENYLKQGQAIANYFGSQRFGSMRQNSADMGKCLLKQDFEAAVNNYLTYTSETENEEFKVARTRLLNEKDYSKALEYYPKNLGFERKILSHLKSNPTDYAGALRKLPRTLLLLFLHAYQANIFNKMIKIRKEKELLDTINEGDLLAPIDVFGFADIDRVKSIGNLQEAKKEIEMKKATIAINLVGPNSKLSEFENKELEKDGIKLEDFLMKHMPELNCSGVPRAITFPLRNFIVDKQDNEQELKLDFEIPSGSYATVALTQLLEINQ